MSYFARLCSIGTPVLAFVTNGDPAINLGIACVVSALRRNAPGDIWELWIVGPDACQLLTKEFLSPICGNKEFRYVGAEDRPEDKYYVQTGLSRLYELLDARHIILCLDFDHVVLETDCSEANIPRSGILVSSEVGPDTLKHCVMDAGAQLPASLLPRQYWGASLILGRVRELRKLGREWKGAYEDLRNIIEVRHRVEIALTLAAERARISVSPCPPQLQGNFAILRHDCWLFHYGGESATSSYLKLKLREVSTQFRRLGPSPERAVALHDDMVIEIIKILSPITPS